MKVTKNTKTKRNEECSEIMGGVVKFMRGISDVCVPKKLKGLFFSSPRMY